MGNDKPAMVEVDLGGGNASKTIAAESVAPATDVGAGMKNGHVDKEEEAREKEKDGKVKEKKEKPNTVGLYRLFFTYATGWDVFLMVVGTVAAIATG